MLTPLDALVGLLTLEPLEETLFRGASQDLGLPQLFGGQVLGQALAAASHTVASKRRAHSLHGYFLRPGDPHQPVVYQVDAIRDGSSFATRRVTAIQKGRPIFFCSASFHSEETGIEHQTNMPEVPTPETLTDTARLVRFDSHPVEFLLAGEENQTGQPAHKRVWFRLAGELPDDPALHRHLLAYSSDFNLLTTALVPHGLDYRNPKLQIASLDHALWFHHDVRVNDWLLYDMDSPWAGGARSFTRGSIYDRHGRLVASSAQEGLTRLRVSPQD